jgi:hypothetical protein
VKKRIKLEILRSLNLSPFFFLFHSNKKLLPQKALEGACNKYVNYTKLIEADYLLIVEESKAVTYKTKRDFISSRA